MKSVSFFKCMWVCVCDRDNFCFLIHVSFFLLSKKKNNERLKYCPACLFLFLCSILILIKKDTLHLVTFFFLISLTIIVKRKANYMHDDCLSFTTISFGSIFTKIQVCLYIYTEDYYYDNTILKY
jgi:hypothetical protein